MEFLGFFPLVDVVQYVYVLAKFFLYCLGSHILVSLAFLLFRLFIDCCLTDLRTIFNFHSRYFQAIPEAAPENE